jgi:hypothetical protein
MTMADTPSTDLAPGMLAFVAFLVLAVSLWLLMRNMNARLRRMSYARRAELEQEQEAGDEIAGEPHPAELPADKPPPAKPPTADLPRAEPPGAEPPGQTGRA